MTPPGRILALDPGSRRVGVAITDPGVTIAQPHSVIDLEREDFDQALRKLVADLDVELVVVGLPVSLSGIEGAAAERARELAARVREATGLPVELFDERLTTRLAEQSMIAGKVRRAERRRRVDKVAAAVLLHSYLESRR